jgi:phosphoenolpyruvate-protein phosphotransferase (PTS system enzyme I)
MGNPRELRGIGVSPGVGLARAVVVRWELPNVPDRTVEPAEVDGEVARLHRAVAETVRALEGLRDRVFQRAGAEASGIFDAQVMLAQDTDFLGQVEHLIRTNRLSAETAFEFKALEVRNLWANAQSARLRDRIADLSAVQIRVLQVLLGKPVEVAWAGPTDAEHVVIVTRELSPGLTVQLDRDQVAGVVSEEGTRTSHAAILAHSLGIPCVMGAVGALAAIRPGAMVLLDGSTGLVLTDPTEGELADAKARLTRRRRTELELEAVVQEPAVGPEGDVFTLLGNVDLPEEIETAVKYGAEGVGLLRTEFLITGRTHLPTEDEQYAYFRRVGAAFPYGPVIIRTFDLGGDKFPAAWQAPSEPNPFLGWRSIRVCLDEPEIFRPQLRAVLRAAADRDLRLMLPLITGLDEVEASLALIAEEAERLAASGVRAAKSVPVGVMIETPAAVAIADQLAKRVAFFSVGSNDLTQYMLVVDRGNARLASRFNSLHPAVVRQLDHVQRAARAANITASVCGEMASEPLAVILLTGLGYDTLSVAPPSLPLVKSVVRSVPRGVATAAAQAALQATSAAEVERLLEAAAAPYLRHR